MLIWNLALVESLKLGREMMEVENYRGANKKRRTKKKITKERRVGE